MNVTFNLVHEPWICTTTTDGDKVLSLQQIFDGTEQPLSVVGDSPTQDYAVLRVLLAIYWRAHHQRLKSSVPTGRRSRGFRWEPWFQEQRNQARQHQRDDIVLAYLKEYEHRFNLIDDEVPFMQVATLHTSKNTHSPISRILPDAEADFFTMRTGAGRASISFPEAARWLIHQHAYDYSGIKSGATGDPRVKGGRGYPIGTGWAGMTGGTVVRGDTLQETLVLNTVKEAVDPTATGDTPIWERDPDTAKQRLFDPSAPKEGVMPNGPADLATWQTRRIRLFPEGDRVTRVLVCNGDRIPDAGKNVFGDPMTPYRYSPNQSKKDLTAYYPKPYDSERTVWNSIDALLVSENDAGFGGKNLAPIKPATLANLAEIADVTREQELLDIAIVSMAYGPQSSSVGTVISGEIGLPLYLLQNNEYSTTDRQRVRAAAQAVRDTAVCLGWFEGQLAVAAGGEYSFGTKSADRLYALLEPEFMTWLRNLNIDDVASECVRWQELVRDSALELAAELVRGAGPKAMIGRLDSTEDGKGRVINAGSIHNQLLRKLRDALPLLAQRNADRTSQQGENHD
ncbi:type I-E CRISPR-associated protein Cse1/CasA [Corynebacterium pseudogenitalium]|uniref:type I-E CRISPR-associated protein Cse1/CasA n=1 Tax=Corynebacterium pseudogenitalium TaxID=38303 RepID=UPI002109E933|nr:type I-E CRISPR-associated protein Cse1/CasA [Corynebacterium pseudogenitalium]MCQ4608638.1 type I-E CRISPR-associated protein Cse1/CasA [Corynebacterium pseudogenitalium]